MFIQSTIFRNEITFEVTLEATFEFPFQVRWIANVRYFFRFCVRFQSLCRLCLAASPFLSEAKNIRLKTLDINIKSRYQSAICRQ